MGSRMIEYPKGYKVTVLRAGNRGRNNRKLALHRADKVRTRRAKRQHPGGHSPEMRLMPWRFV